MRNVWIIKQSSKQSKHQEKIDDILLYSLSSTLVLAGCLLASAGAAAPYLFVPG
jgi:hypothetical protein